MEVFNVRTQTINTRASVETLSDEVSYLQSINHIVATVRNAALFIASF
jgi:hypothetical protein